MAGHVREIQYPTWLANVVMVRKSSGKWRMCTDFTDLNKACPKGSYPLPNIDCLVDGASGYELLRFMDAYSGYNQIRMHPADEDKTAFIADQANFCYRVMPFGLKNVGATYQRLMDKVLVNQLGQNVEAYVDDMVVKSESVSRHFDDLQELFDTIGMYQLKLNPEKCSFGVQAGKFITFREFTLNHVPREQNSRADLLSKLASTKKPGATRSVIQETLTPPSINSPQGSVLFIQEELDSLMGPYIAYLTRGELLEDKKEASLIQRESARFVTINERLYRKGFSSPLLRCLTTSQAEKVMDEVHSGMCGSHIGGRALVYKVARAGYFWLSLRNDCINWVQKCDGCQRHATLHHSPAERLHSILSPWPFNKWGIDILGPFPIAVRQLKFLIVAVDYFSKWIEAEPVATISAEKVRAFLWKNVVCRYGVPQVLVSDNGTQFASARVRDFCGQVGIGMIFTSVEHPQSNGQAESANKVILSGLKKRVQDSGASWVEELPRVLWSYHTTVHSSAQDTPFNLVYGTDAMIPIEIAEPSVCTTAFSEEESDQGRRVDLDLIAETREIAKINQVAAQRRAAFKYNIKVVPRDFVVGDLVLKRAQLTQMRNKLSPKWVGPYKIDDVVGKGAYRLRTLDGGMIPRTWNAANLRFYYS
uniref:Uncharacterized protein K02A2.6 n=1 Tax=Cajanus cajan TaxID=3821 RepID=A0A151SBF8_CAJCA|nr:Uncharacterized protein K02A2.6 [Cajanus cajan]